MRAVIGSGVVVLALLGVSVVAAYAGGCCYQKFEVNQGVAGYTSARIYTGFFDPRSGSEPLVNTPIEIHIVNPEIDQSCWMDAETTDADGLVSATCTSERPGEVAVFFSSPDLSQADNDQLGFGKKSVYFAAGKVEDLRQDATPVPYQKLEDATSSHQLESLEAKVDNLSTQVSRQGELLGRLEAVLQEILGLIKRVLGLS